MLARASTKTFVSRVRETAKKIFVSRKIHYNGHSLAEVSLYLVFYCTVNKIGMNRLMKVQSVDVQGINRRSFWESQGLRSTPCCRNTSFLNTKRVKHRVDCNSSLIGHKQVLQGVLYSERQETCSVMGYKCDRWSRSQCSKVYKPFWLSLWLAPLRTLQYRRLQPGVHTSSHTLM